MYALTAADGKMAQRVSVDRKLDASSTNFPSL